MDLFIHDLAFQWGGAERVFSSLAAVAPRAPVAVIAGDEKVLRAQFPGRNQRILYPRLRSNLHARSAAPVLARRLPRLELDAERQTISSYAMARWIRAPRPRLV